MSLAPLLPEQDELLVTLVEASRSVPQNQRSPFLLFEHAGGTTLAHPGLEAIGKATYQPYVGDAKTLASRGLIRLEPLDDHSYEADHECLENHPGPAFHVPSGSDSALLVAG
jgi:hypothetical protein